jgi:hypothetical protein
LKSTQSTPGASNGETLATELGIPRTDYEPHRWRFPDGSIFYPPRYRWCLLVKAIIERFCPVIAPGGQVLYLAEAEDWDDFKN